MRDKTVKLIISALLHDIGKVVYRSGDGRNHSISGYDFLKEEAKIEDEEILEAVKYHHGKLLSKSDVIENSNAYIVYIADNIASASDRRESMEEDYGFESSIPLSSVFNILNENNQNFTYAPEMLDTDKGINNPKAILGKFEEGFYNEVAQKLKINLGGMSYDSRYINSLLEVIEATCTYIPSSTNKGELADVSLYDHVKLTAAISSCILQYLEENGCRNYKKELFNEAKEFYKKKVFCLYSMDISGIQDFIYTITSKDALKMLRARSFYLEIMMEHIIDELFEKIELSRANLIYVGGGHCYILLPNTAKVKACIEEYEKNINQWLMNKFDTSLYIAGAYCECSAENLKNVPDGSYAELFMKISNRISDKKLCRYDANDIIALNSKRLENYERECCVCKRIGNVNKDRECKYCQAIKAMSKHILYSEFFVVTLEKDDNFLELPGEKYLTACDKDKVKKLIGQDNNFVRAYSVNKMYAGKNLATKLWVGNYTKGSTFEELAQSAEGIDRIAVYRADVDNLGTAFVNGFKQMNGKYETLSRTATLSRQLSLFFKKHINYILEHPKFSLTKEIPKRDITIVYSGGDDIFLVGAWNDVLEFSIDLRQAFDTYTQGTLTLSGGIGLYKSGYPVSAMASEVQKLESIAKDVDSGKFILNQGIKEKNAISLFQKEIVFKWDKLENGVLEEKFNLINEFFSANKGYGKNFLYNLLKLIQNRGDKINFARYVYILSRMEPDFHSEEQLKSLYRKFSKKMYEWMQEDGSTDELIAAIYIYIYLNRVKEDENNENY